jgi:hypothetical protein
MIKTRKTKDKIMIVDGKQRLRAIISFRRRYDLNE